MSGLRRRKRESVRLPPTHPSPLGPRVLHNGEATAQPTSSPQSPSPFPSMPHALLPLASTFPGMKTRLGQTRTIPGWPIILPKQHRSSLTQRSLLREGLDEKGKDSGDFWSREGGVGRRRVARGRGIASCPLSEALV